MALLDHLRDMSDKLARDIGNEVEEGSAEVMEAVRRGLSDVSCDLGSAGASLSDARRLARALAERLGLEGDLLDAYEQLWIQRTHQIADILAGEEGDPT